VAVPQERLSCSHGLLISERSVITIVAPAWSTDVPKYFFHVTDGTNHFRDREGALFPDDASAHKAAQQIANDFWEDQGYEEFYIDVRNEDDIQIAKIPIRARH
jgi:hypothetical protein